MRNRLQAYKINHASFGSERISYHGETAPLFRCWLVPWSVFVATILLSTMWIWLWNESSYTLEGGGTETDAPKKIAGGAVGAFGFAFLLFYVAMFWYGAAEVRHFTNHTRFADLHFISDPSRRPDLVAVYVVRRHSRRSSRVGRITGALGRHHHFVGGDQPERSLRGRRRCRFDLPALRLFSWRVCCKRSSSRTCYSASSAGN